jgi:hypothetical protein
VVYEVVATIQPTSSLLTIGIFRSRAVATRTQAGSAVGVYDNTTAEGADLTLPFQEGLNPGTPGTASANVSGNNLVIQVTGLAAPVAWSSLSGGASVPQGKLVTNGGNLYVYTVAGTIGTGPTGTTTGTDGTAHYAFVVAYTSAWATVTISWTAALRILTG